MHSNVFVKRSFKMVAAEARTFEIQFEYLFLTKALHTVQWYSNLPCLGSKHFKTILWPILWARPQDLVEEALFENPFWRSWLMECSILIMESSILHRAWGFETFGSADRHRATLLPHKHVYDDAKWSEGNLVHSKSKKNVDYFLGRSACRLDPDKSMRNVCATNMLCVLHRNLLWEAHTRKNSASENHVWGSWFLEFQRTST